MTGPHVAEGPSHPCLTLEFAHLILTTKDGEKP